jgi:hypothetical protein
MEDTENKEGKSFEIKAGVTIAVFAAALAITDLFGGKYGDDEIKAVNEKSAAFMWYQSKSIKETVVEGQHDLLQALRSAGAIAPGQVQAIDAHIQTLGENISRYGKEKKEILLGSKGVGEKNWIQDVGGELGKVTGAKEWEATVEQLSRIGDTLDIATLFLQLCLVIGAVGLVVQSVKTREMFYWMMCGFGAIGSAITAYTLLALTHGLS